MSDLRNDVALYLANWCGETEPTEADWKAADAVLRVVGERLLSDEGVRAGSSNQRRCSDTLSRNVLSAAWRVVTGSNAAVSGGDEGNTP